MTLFDTIRATLSPTSAIGVMSGGFVPLPPSGHPHGGGANVLIVNCELPDYLEHEDAAKVLQLSRNKATAVLRAIAATALEDTSGIAVRLGLYSGGTQLRETVYCCSVPYTFLAEGTAANDFKYWDRKFDVSYPIEYSTLTPIAALLKPASIP